MKKEMLITLLIGVIGIGGIGFLMMNKPSTRPVPSSVIPTGSQVSTSFKLSDIAIHTSAEDCWVIVENNIFNVTSYIPNHPGGPDKIIPLCGKDATAAFNTKGGKGPHSLKAQETLTSMFVGTIE